MTSIDKLDYVETLPEICLRLQREIQESQRNAAESRKLVDVLSKKVVKLDLQRCKEIACAEEEKKRFSDLELRLYHLTCSLWPKGEPHPSPTEKGFEEAVQARVTLLLMKNAPVSTVMALHSLYSTLHVQFQSMVELQSNEDTYEHQRGLEHKAGVLRSVLTQLESLEKEYSVESIDLALRAMQAETRYDHLESCYELAVIGARLQVRKSAAHSMELLSNSFSEGASHFEKEEKEFQEAREKVAQLERKLKELGVELSKEVET